MKRKHPRAKIIVTGCIDERGWEGVDVWVKDKDNILSAVRDIMGEGYPRDPSSSLAGARFARDDMELVIPYSKPE